MLHPLLTNTDAGPDLCTSFVLCCSKCIMQSCHFARYTVFAFYCICLVYLDLAFRSSQNAFDWNKDFIEKEVSVTLMHMYTYTECLFAL